MRVIFAAKWSKNHAASERSAVTTNDDSRHFLTLRAQLNDILNIRTMSSEKRHKNSLINLTYANGWVHINVTPDTLAL